jgi:alkylation response protein AidB-like acyl-CoA dehydrogenase
VYTAQQLTKFNIGRAAAAARAGRAPGPEGSLGKLAMTGTSTLVSETVATILGPRLVVDDGTWGTFAWAEYVCGVPGTRLAGGTDEVQRNILSERVLGLPRVP